MLVGMWSGPVALCSLSVHRSLWMPSGVIMMCCMNGCGLVWAAVFTFNPYLLISINDLLISIIHLLISIIHLLISIIHLLISIIHLLISINRMDVAIFIDINK